MLKRMLPSRLLRGVSASLQVATACWLRLGLALFFFAVRQPAVAPIAAPLPASPAMAPITAGTMRGGAQKRKGKQRLRLHRAPLRLPEPHLRGCPLSGELVPQP